MMAIVGPLFAAGGVGIALLHAATPDPLAELAAVEPGEVAIEGKVASAPTHGEFGSRADVRVERLWYENKEIIRGGGVEVFAPDMAVGVGDRVRVVGEITPPEPGKDGFDYARYLSTKRISAVLDAGVVQPVGSGSGWIGRVHHRTDLALGYGLRPREASIVRGMVLGDRSRHPRRIADEFPEERNNPHTRDIRTARGRFGGPRLLRNARPRRPVSLPCRRHAYGDLALHTHRGCPTLGHTGWSSRNTRACGPAL